MSESKKLIPKRRFIWFYESWKNYNLGNIAEIVRGASPRPIQDNKWFDKRSQVGWLRIKDVTEQNGRIYYLEQRLSKAGQEKTRVIFEPHLLLSIAATVGRPVINYVETGVHDGFLIFLNPKFHVEFMFQYLDMLRPQWLKYGQPGSQINLNSDIVKNHCIGLPDDEEQIQIGEFFKKLDNLIQTQQKKIQKTKTLKSAYLAEMFPCDGELKPRYRFLGFKDNWKVYLIKELGVIYTGNTPSTTDKNNWAIGEKGHVWVTPTDIKSLLISDSERYLTDIGWKKARVLPENSILITSIASIGKNSINTVPLAFNQQINAIIPYKNNAYFILTIMEKEKKRFAQLAGHTSMAIINKTEFGNFTLIIPHEKEQAKIGNFFKLLDSKIALEQKKLEKLNNIKQAYLNEMFV